MSLFSLPDYASILVHGPDARGFLQSQLSSNIDAVTPERAQLSAWHDPKGRVLAVVTVATFADGFVLVMPRALREGVLRRMKLFVLRSKVDIEAGPEVAGLVGDQPPMPVADAAWSAAGDNSGVAVRLPGEQRWLVVGADALAGPGDTPARDEWEAAAVAAGLPEVYEATAGVFVAQMLNLDELGAVSFDKGCFPGQEIIARAHYLGRVKRRMRRFLAAGAPPPPGAELGEPGGKVVRAAPAEDGCTILAVVPADARGPFVLADGRSLEPGD